MLLCFYFSYLNLGLGFYASSGPAVADLVADLDGTLFASVLANDKHELHNLLPDRNDCSYRLRRIFFRSMTMQKNIARHDRVLPIRRDNRNFFDRHLFKDMYF